MSKSPEIRRVLAVDFETAAPQRASACSMGLCLLDFQTGEIIEKRHFLINPEVEFCKRNISIHGITPDMVSDMPSFPQILPELISRIDQSTIVVSHNAPFDVSVILRSCQRYNLEPPEFCYYCTLAYSKSLLPGLPSYTLDFVSNHLMLPSFSHHAADDDAEACARIFYELTLPLHLNTVPSIDRKTKVKHKNSKEKYSEIVRESQSSSGMSVRLSSKSSSNIVSASAPRSTKNSDTEYQVYESSPFFGMHVVFTGSLQTFTRPEAMEAVLQAGGLVGNSVSSYTDIVICGDGYRHDNPLPLSRKITCAKRFISKGKKISFIDESEFISMLTDFEIIKESFGSCT